MSDRGEFWIDSEQMDSAAWNVDPVMLDFPHEWPDPLSAWVWEPEPRRGHIEGDPLFTFGTDQPSGFVYSPRSAAATVRSIGINGTTYRPTEPFQVRYGDETMIEWTDERVTYTVTTPNLRRHWWTPWRHRITITKHHLIADA